MKIINFGSINIDHVYSVENFAAPGETLAALDYKIFPGGKGLNQSVAAARAGACVYHAGMFGQGCSPAKEILLNCGVNLTISKDCDEPQGHAVIQVNNSGENCILLFRGSNYAVTEKYIDWVFEKINPPGYILLQNEISGLPYIINKAVSSGFQTVLNASPVDGVISSINLNKISWLMINEIEGQQITGETVPEQILNNLEQTYPALQVLLTLGKDGAICSSFGKRYYQPIFDVKTIDTTAAGDTTTGYFIAALTKGMEIPDAMKLAAKASSIAVTRHGAASSIPTLDEVELY